LSCSVSSFNPRPTFCAGSSATLTTRDALLTDDFGVGGIGRGCVSTGLLTLAALFLVLGFGLFGKNLLDVSPIGPENRAQSNPSAGAAQQ
jgi:hypothetical protein